MPVATPTTRMKLGFKDRHWTEMEWLWRSKARESPNIESLMKPQANYRSKDRQARARTLPFSATPGSEKPSPAHITTSVSVSHLGSAARSPSGPAPRWPPPSPTAHKPRQVVQKTLSSSSLGSKPPPRGQMSTTASLLAAHSQAVMPAVSLGTMDSPLQTKKAIDLLAPHVFTTWQSRDFKCIDTISASSNESQEEEERDHFAELKKAW